MAVKYVSPDVYRRNKIRRNAIISTLIFLIVATVILWLVFNTDFFRTKRSSFIRYFSNMTEVLDTWRNFDDENLKKELKNRSYIEKGSMKIKSATNVADSSILDRVRFDFESKVNNQEKRKNVYIKVSGGNGDLANISYIQDNDIYGILVEDIAKAYISVKNEDLRNLIDNIDIQKTETLAGNFTKGLKFDYVKLMANSMIEVNKNEVIDITKIQKQKIENYYKIIKDNVPTTAYSKKENDKILIDGENYKVTSYTLSLNPRESSDLVKLLIDNLTKDSIMMEFLSTKLRFLNLNENYTDINKLNQELKNISKEYEKNPEVFGGIEIKVSEEKQKNIQTEMTIGTHKIVLNHLKSNQEEKSIIRINNSEIRLIKANDYKKIRFLTNNEEKQVKSFEIEEKITGNVQDNNIQKISTIESVDGIKKIQFTYNATLKFVDNVDIKGFLNEKVLILNEYSKEEISKFLEDLYKKINEVYISKGSSIGINLDPIF